MAGIRRGRIGHGIETQEWSPYWRGGADQPRESVARYLARHAGLPAAYPYDDLSQPPAPLVEYRPAPDIPQSEAGVAVHDHE